MTETQQSLLRRAGCPVTAVGVPRAPATAAVLGAVRDAIEASGYPVAPDGQAGDPAGPGFRVTLLDCPEPARARITWHDPDSGDPHLMRTRVCAALLRRCGYQTELLTTENGCGIAAWPAGEHP